MSKLQVDDIVNKGDDGSPSFPKGAVVTGVTTSTSVVATNTVSVGGTSVNTLIDGKTSPGKAIALSMVFG